MLTQDPGIFEDKPAEFSSLFRRVLSMTLDTTLSTTIRTHLLCFLIHAFQSLDCAIVRKECAPLVSISIWHNLSSDRLRETKLEESPHLKKAWRAAAKRYDAADDATKARLRFERSWLYTLVLNFLGLVYNETSKAGKSSPGALHALQQPLTRRRRGPPLRAVRRVLVRLAEPASHPTLRQHTAQGPARYSGDSAISHVQ